MQLRNAILINGMLCSVEAVFGLTASHIDKLEQCDRYFMRKLFNSPVSTPIESFYLETGAIPIRFTIIARRLLFYWTILNKQDSELVKQVYNIQKIQPVKKDWCLTVAEDLRNLNIELSEVEITKIKKIKFKSIVKENVRAVARNFLSDLKGKHSKSENLQVRNEMQSYLSSSELSCDEKKLLFSLRTRMFDCKANFSFKYGSNLLCKFCHETEDQEHLLQCVKLIDGISLDGIQYSDIFGNLKKQVVIAKTMKKIVDKRDIMLNDISLIGNQEHHI